VSVPGNRLPSRLRGRAAELELRGRRSECGVLDRLIEAVRAGESRALVVRGEPGVGKTALLDYLAEHASGCRVARATGVQSEMELAFAALHQLCAPILDRVERLPGPQRDALGTAFGISPGSAPDRFFIGLAVLSLLSEVAEEQPLVCWWMTSSGWIAPPRRCWRSSRAAWRRSRSAWCWRPGFPATSWRGCRSWWSRACVRPMRAGCWRGC
jgi:AAA ATPase domain